MNKCISRIMLVGHSEIGALARSYRVALEELGHEVACFDINSAIDNYCRFGYWGRKFNSIVPVETWMRKANSELVIRAREFAADAVIVVGNCRVRAGALAQIKASLDPTLIHIWPDTLVNLDSSLIECLPMYDLECVYSQNAVKPLQRLGAIQPVWMPLAGDPSLHGAVQCTVSEAADYGAAVTFIGGWRPEREAVLSALTHFNLKIWGPDWGRRCKNNPTIMKAWQGRALRGREFAKAVASSNINLNIIDQTNYPAANMRFFEIPCAGGLQVCSPCPEMELEFKHGEAAFYYLDESELPTQIYDLLNDGELCRRVRQAAHRKVMEKHTYLHRAKQILSMAADQRSAATANILRSCPYPYES
jgi:Glycosyl transferases group 1